MNLISRPCCSFPWNGKSPSLINAPCRDEMRRSRERTHKGKRSMTLYWWVIWCDRRIMSPADCPIQPGKKTTHQRDRIYSTTVLNRDVRVLSVSWYRSVSQCWFQTICLSDKKCRCVVETTVTTGPCLPINLCVLLAYIDPVAEWKWRTLQVARYCIMRSLHPHLYLQLAYLLALMFPTLVS